jgi:transcription-repair coupling factor (superfamily II helicase)
VDPMSLVKLVQSDPRSFKLAGATRLRFEQRLPDIDERQRYLEQLMDTFITEPNKSTDDA